MVKLIIFDYDGVIVDSFPNVHSVYQIICEKLGKSCPDNLEDFKKVYGHSSLECYANLSFTEEERVKGNMMFKEEILKKDAKPFDGIIEVLKELHKSYKLVVISSSYKEEVEQKLEKFGILNLFDFILAKENHIGRFEKTGSIKKVMENLAIKSNEVLLIGDRNVDFIEGEKAGLNNILLVEYGWGYDLKEIPEYTQKVLIKNPIDLLDFVSLN
ncbi:MAG: HAD-IA family hydrolase [Candidatus Magasanikbacteria bacterium]|jgi:phosphoglycolate phosphatase|nr:HAD-IA family hydrolase [Candidatus Magasanikbacteria bacterium]MBT4071733.1 HAD-IA family hydrolase [Candidatus Magasanikbacteria bacterium]